MSRGSTKGKIMRVVRTRTLRNGKVEREVVIIDDPDVVREYSKKENAREIDELRDNIANFKPTGDKDKDSRMILMLEDELARLNRNKDRRQIREQQKGRVSGTGGESAGGDDGEGKAKIAGTQRRCANCGQIGHIKTNKKLCPMLNGTQQPQTGFDTTAFGGSGSVVATPATERTFSI